MKNTRSIVQGFMLCVCLAASFAVAAEQESIVVDSNDDYVITYKSYLGWQKVTWVPATKINPTVRGVVRPVTGKPDNLSYNYTVLNGKDSRQFLVGLNLLASNVLSPDARSPDGWSGGAALDRAAGSGFIVGWSPWPPGDSRPDGLKTGAAVSGFGFDSKDLPGIGKIRLYGEIWSDPNVIPNNFPDEGPDEDSPIYAEFIRITNDNDFIARLAAVPHISVPVPFNAAVVLANIQKHLDTDLVSMKLVDPAIVAQMDPWFATAIDAAKRNSTAGLRNALQELRRLLKQECADVDQEGNETDTDDKPVPPARIAKLAARVLNFDLKYVGSRI